MIRQQTDTSGLRLGPPRPASFSCPTCAVRVDARSRHVVVQGSSVQVYCSRECKDGALLDDLGLVVESPPEPEPEPPRRRVALGILSVATVAVALGAPAALWLLFGSPGAVAPADAGPEIAARADAASARADAEPEPYGPVWPPPEEDWIRVLARDAWIHPLPGPDRYMPTRHSRVFGASRPGDRPAECRSGHCGVDLGGPSDWGEHVLAVHDGVVEHVERGPNPESGGRYVRLSHRGGTVFTEYFHLAAIPRRIRPGRRVEMGELIGLLGESGIKNSGPHLHFTILVQPAEDMPRQFVDPEPLIALWPLKIPVDCEEGSIVSPHEPPGYVRGAAPRRPPKKKTTKKRKRHSEQSGADAGAAGPRADGSSPG